jgi:hypothetical protein
MIGLNAIQPPGLPDRFAPVNGLALQQQAQGSGYQPAYAPPAQLAPDQAPDAGASLDALQKQMGGADPTQGIRPNSSTPPAAQGAPGGAAAPAPAPAAPMSFSDILSQIAMLSPNHGGGVGQAGQNIVTNFGASPLGQFFANMGQPQAPNLGQLPGPAPQVNLGTPNIVPPIAPPGGVLGGARQSAPVPGGGILGF